MEYHLNYEDDDYSSPIKTQMHKFICLVIGDLNLLLYQVKYLNNNLFKSNLVS